MLRLGLVAQGGPPVEGESGGHSRQGNTLVCTNAADESKISLQATTKGAGCYRFYVGLALLFELGKTTCVYSSRSDRHESFSSKGAGSTSPDG